MALQKRRKAILEVLQHATDTVTGQHLSDTFGVSRQVIVQDIAVLRANGESIIATPRGYMLATAGTAKTATATVACSHGMAHVKDELLTVVQNGGEILDVIVEHPLYGQITGILMIKTVGDVEGFVQRVRETNASLLSSLTNGIHLHTISAKDARSLGRVVSALKTHGYLVGEE